MLDGPFGAKKRKHYGSGQIKFIEINLYEILTLIGGKNGNLLVSV